MHDISITYLGEPDILTHPLYLKWSQKNLNDIKVGLSSLKTDMGNIEANMDNLNIIGYLSTLLRIVGLI
jgi:hypothetical protein